MNLTIKINGEIYDFFESVTLVLKYDGIASSFSITSYFDPDNESHKKLFKPLSYNLVQIYYDNNIIFTGTVISPKFDVSTVEQLTTITGYSLPGVLEDCQIPLNLYPLQSDKRTLKEIADRLTKPFGLKIVIDNSVKADMNRIYKVTTANESQTIKSYLNSLAIQRGIILSHTAEGELFFTKAATRKLPIDGINYTSGSLGVNGQMIHSQISVIRQASIESNNAGQKTIKNPFVNYFRPSVSVQSSGDDNDTSKAAKKKLQSEMKAIQLDLNLESFTWKYNDNDVLIMPNNIISIQDNRLYLYNKTDFFVEQVTLKQTKNSQTASIVCFLPEVYSDDPFKDIFK